MTTVDMRQRPDGTWADPSDRGHDFNAPGSTSDTIRFYHRAVFRKILGIFLVLTLFIAIMVAVNVLIHPWWNTFFFLILTILTVANLWSPIPVVTAGLVGFLYSSFDNTDRSQGTLNGIRILLDKITVSTLIFLQVVVGFLATWPLAENPGAVMYVLCAAVLIALVFHRFNLGGGRWFAWGVVAYSGVILAIALWTTIPESLRTWIPGYNYLNDEVAEKTPGPQQPPTYRNGDTLVLGRGQSLTIILAGEITIPNHVRGDCVKGSPKGKIAWVSNQGNTTIKASPKSGKPELVTIHLRVPGQVNEEGQVTCPPLRR
jgi:hypothetical protein